MKNRLLFLFLASIQLNLYGYSILHENSNQYIFIGNLVITDNYDAKELDLENKAELYYKSY